MLGDGRASEVLVGGIAALLERHGVEKSTLSLIAVASGPGSFTGLRVALATAKGLAEAFAIPVVPVSVLEALALASGVQGRVVAAVDAQRAELFFGEYIVGESILGESIVDAANAPTAELLREGIASFEDFVSVFASGPSLRIVTPDPLLAAQLRETAIGIAQDILVVPRPTAQDIARIAHRKFLAGFRADVAALDANYLRRSDAEIVAARKPRSPG
jgi:tRNA threonylcarbamoyladenosine biosynthesis protein TsaB